ncbi:hypothetical protein Tco_1291420 [Tanacetum coccineum]
MRVTSSTSIIREASLGCLFLRYSPPSPLTPLSSPLPHIPSPLLPASPLERILKKRTKNEAKTTKPDSEWKSRKRQSQSPRPNLKKSTQVNPEAKSQEI